MVPFHKSQWEIKFKVIMEFSNQSKLNTQQFNFWVQSFFTCFGVNREVRLAVEDAVDHSGTVSISGVICISGCHLRHVGSCQELEDGSLSVSSFVEVDLLTQRPLLHAEANPG